MKNLIINTCIVLCLLTILLYRTYSAVHNPQRASLRDSVGHTITFIGKIIDEPLTKDFTKTFILETNDALHIKVSTDKYAEYGYGDTVKVKGKLSSPRNFSNTDGRVFNYVDYLGKDGIFYEFKKAEVFVLQADDRRSIMSRLFYLKQSFINNLKNVLGEPHAALASGLVVGEKAALGASLIDDFRRTGLIHIVVLSGYNITIIGVSFRRLLSFLPRTWAILAGGLGIILFGMLVGGGATVVRSCIMALIALFAELVRRDYGAGRALFMAGLLMLIQNPLILLYDPSFQLSFLATLGLVTLSTPIEKRLSLISEKWGIRALVASTLATQILVSPLIFYMMGQLSIVGIFVNIIVLPLIPITMLLVFLAGFVGFFSHFFSQLAGWASHILLSYELTMVNLFARLPFASIEVPAFSLWIVGGFYTIYLALFLKLPSAVSQFIFAKKSST